MKININRQRLLKALNIVNVAIGQKSPDPIYINFKFVMNDEYLEITGSNGDLTICSKISIQDKNSENYNITSYEKGATLISSKYLIEIIRGLDSEFVTIEVIDDVIAQISDKQSNFKLNSMPIEEYPDLDLAIEGTTVTFKANELKKIIFQTAFAASNKEVRPVLTALNVKSFNNQMEFTATDSFRLSKKIFNIETTDFEVNIPVRTLNEVSKMLENSDVKMIVSQRKVVFEFDDTIIYSRLINGDFPKISRMIPDAYPYVLQVSAEMFSAAIARVSLLAIERENIVKLSITPDSLEISSKSDQIGSANETISTFRYAGERFDISFNVNYVLDAIKATQSDDVILSFAGEMSAFRITAPNDNSIIQIITPVRSYY